MINTVEKALSDGKVLSIETGRVAKEAGGSVIVRIGDTMILATATMSLTPREGIDFFPLMVEFEEKLYAAGKIPGGFFKREGRLSEKAILNCRKVDRPIRPMFPEGFRNDVQVVVTPLSVDQENPHDVLGIIGASAALSISDIPFDGPIGAVRVSIVDGKFVANPTQSQTKESTLDLVIAGTKTEISMIEAGANQISEDQMLEAIKFGHTFIKESIAMQEELVKKAGKEKAKVEEYKISDKVRSFVTKEVTGRIEKAMRITDREKQMDELDAIKSDVKAKALENKELEDELKKHPGDIKAVIEEIEYETMRRLVLKENKRVDGRGPNDIREINCEIGTLPRTHGSAIFSRGQTQVLTIVTLGSAGEEQRLEGLDLEETGKRYMHHYNFPPFSVGEVRPMRGPGRREIGHGALAEKALLPVIPDKESFPYTIRLVSEILSSNGSSSMASTCGSNLALLDAGVPIKSVVGGVSVGIVIGEDGKYKLLTDIQGPEDHFGGMDFKIAGSTKGITAIQLDVKTDGLTAEMIRDTLEQSRKNRIEIIDVMSQTLGAPRSDLSAYAPRIITLKINPEKIRDVIGPGGKIINQIIDETGVEIDIEDDGLVFITADNPEAGAKALEWVKNLTHEVVPGEVFQGRITRIMNFGAFAEILPGQEGMVHISEISEKRIGKVEDVLKVGQMVTVKVKEIDNLGRINLTMRGLENSVK